MQTQHTQNDGALPASDSKVVVIWLISQWNKSLAREIWNDLTPFGRATIWIPLWFLCWCVILFAFPILLTIVYPIYWVNDKYENRFGKLPPIFFAR